MFLLANQSVILIESRGILLHTLNMEEKGDFLRVGFSRVTEKVTEKVTEEVTEKLTANQEKILELIEQDNHITTSEMAEHIGISKRKILDNISKLKSKNKIERVGTPKKGYWKIKDKDAPDN